MDLVKSYIIQSISVASNNLRLNPQKIEVVALLREAIIKSGNIGNDINEMKKITELSTIAIRLNKIYDYLTQGQPDFMKLSEKFKEHSQFLIKDLSHMLDMTNPTSFKQVLNKLNPDTSNKSSSGESSSGLMQKKERAMIIKLGIPDKESSFETSEEMKSDKLKEEMILSEDKVDNDLLFENYEETILKPIKTLDAMFKRLVRNEVSLEDLKKFANVMKQNSELSSKIGFEIISNMHRIISKSLLLIRARELMPGKEIIEAMRACLIVIVAVVKGKEVDISKYLNRAEEFGKKLQSLNIKE